MNETMRDYELLAADASPVGLLVLSGDKAVVRHANRAVSVLTGETVGRLVGQRLDEVVPALAAALQPVLEAVTRRGRPARTPGLILGPPPLSKLDMGVGWDAFAAPLPADAARTPPEQIAIWLWPEETGTTSSRRVAEALRDALRDTVPPVIPGYELAAALVPSEPGAALGGDTYDVLFLGDGRWAILMADVSGRGPAAAARAVMVRHSCRVLVAQYGPGEALIRLSRLLLADPSFVGFVTAFLGVLDTTSGLLTYAVAGHEPAFIQRGATGEVEEMPIEGVLPLAVDEGTVYPERTTPLALHDLLLLYTDGLTESRRDEEFFDAERVRAALKHYSHLPAPALVASLLAEAEEWAGPGALRDDTALLVVRGREARSEPARR